MHIHIIAVGRLKQGPERDLAERYRERFEALGRKLGFKGPSLRELSESRARDAPTRMAEEAAAIEAIIPSGAALIVLDERGTAQPSTDFARSLAARRDSGASDCAFVIGGADGLSPELRAKAVSRLAFGPATWPHQMVRIMLFEQLYRAATILAGHPYHRV